MNQIIVIASELICCIYICFKLLHQITFTFNTKLSIMVTTIICIFISVTLKLYIPALTYIIPLFLLWITISFITTQPQTSFIGIVIAFTFSHTLCAISCLIATVLIAPLFHETYINPNTVIHIINIPILTMLSMHIFRIKRFRKGMPFLFTHKNSGISTILCLFLLIFAIPLPKLPTFWFKIFALIILIVSLAILIYWWQAQLTKTYKQRLIFRELESLRTELQEKDKLIAHLMEQNKELGRLIHRDNKRIPAMEQAVCEYLSLDVSNTEILKEQGQILISEIQELSTSRSNQLASIHNKRYEHFTTGIHSLDMMLNYMGKRCVQKNGRLAVHTALDLQQYIPNVITTEDCSHLLSDLLENAYHAACHANTPAIQLQFYLAEHAFIIEVSDNGVPFEPASLVQFGLTQRTTRAKDGGSGIGLMDIWRIKEKYRATLHIEELEPSAPYTKKLSFIFNRKNQYTIRTYRKEEIQKLVNRTDLQIYSYNH